MQLNHGNNQEHTQLLALPLKCLVAVLQRLRTRGSDSTSDSRSVCSAARAHSRLQAAAVAALSSNRATVNQQQLDSLLSYLARHSQHVSSLEVARQPGGAHITLRELPPCHQLRSLQLDDITVQLGASGGGHLGVLQAVPPQLTRLHVSGDGFCSLLDSDADALTAALARLRGLQHLALVQLNTEVQGVSLRAQQQLTHLNVPVRLLGDASEAGWRQQLRSLSALRELVLELDDGNALRAGDLTSGLTRLSVTSNEDTAGLMEPGVLAGVRQLQDLELWDIVIAGEAPTTALLHQLGRLQELKRLRLDGGLVDPLAPAPAYSALVASTRLQCLELWSCQLPPDAWQHVFSAQRPALQELVVAHCGTLSPRDVESMVAACPGLQRLTLQYFHNAEAQPPHGSQLLAPLTRLSQLSSLVVGGVDDAAAAAVLAQLSGLRELDTCNTSGLTVAGLLVLTSLRGLTRLSFNQGQLRRIPCLLNNQAPEGSPPDVWRQLLERCAQQSDDPVVRQLAWASAATEARLEALQQQLQEHAAAQRASQARQQQAHDREVAQMQRRLGAQEAQMAGVQQQLAAQQVQLAAVLQRLAAGQPPGA